MSVAEKAGIKDPATIAYYNKMYEAKNEANAIKAIQNKEASKLKNLAAQAEAEKIEAARLLRILQTATQEVTE